MAQTEDMRRSRAGPTPRVFVSHSHRDNDFGIKLVHRLRRELGNDDAVWYDKSGGLLGGDEWWHKILAELTARPIFIVVLSPHALTSKWVNDEINIAWNQKNSPGGKLIIPVLYSNCEIRADLKTLHIVSFLPPNTYEEAFNDLLKAIKQNDTQPTTRTTLPAPAPRRSERINRYDHRLPRPRTSQSSANTSLERPTFAGRNNQGTSNDPPTYTDDDIDEELPRPRRRITQNLTESSPRRQTPSIRRAPYLYENDPLQDDTLEEVDLPRPPSNAVRFIPTSSNTPYPARRHISNEPQQSDEFGAGEELFADDEPGRLPPRTTSNYPGLAGYRDTMRSRYQSEALRQARMEAAPPSQQERPTRNSPLLPPSRRRLPPANQLSESDLSYLTEPEAEPEEDWEEYRKVNEGLAPPRPSSSTVRYTATPPTTSPSQRQLPLPQRRPSSGAIPKLPMTNSPIRTTTNGPTRITRNIPPRPRTTRTTVDIYELRSLKNQRLRIVAFAVCVVAIIAVLLAVISTSFTGITFAVLILLVIGIIVILVGNRISK